MNPNSIKQDIDQAIAELKAWTIQNASDLEQFRLHFLGAKGKLKHFYSLMAGLDPADRKIVGQWINELKQLAEVEFQQSKVRIEEAADAVPSEGFDLSRPPVPYPLGARHPVMVVRNRILDIFKSIGYTVEEGPEIEDDFHNFSALNFPADHPARDMQDTFFIQNNPDILLRTHTSNIQIRVMKNQKPPLRVIAPGRVFRNETVSARSHCFFHQVEGFYIDRRVSFADLKQTLLYFAEAMFGATQIRLRPSYFPFTEPSAEMDIYWGLNNEIDHRITKGTGWLEILGCGMIDPQVLANTGIDPEEYSGFAFGMGLERMVMQQYQIADIRWLSENDVRFLEQFKATW